MTDPEYAHLRRLAADPDMKNELDVLQAAWSDTAFGYFCDRALKYDGVECMAGPDHRSIIMFDHRSRRKLPAFIYVHREPRSRYDWSASIGRGYYTVEVIEAGKHVLAGVSEDPQSGPETEG